MRAVVTLASSIEVPIVGEDLNDLMLVERARPRSLRTFDQIPMRGHDLVRQVKQIAPAFDGATVAFIGDSDGMSPMLGLLSARNGPRPAAMHLLDFDDRLLDAVSSLAAEYGFDDILHTWHYNVFDAPPPELARQCEWFYTNPPFGQRNNGESARLFIARGMEMVTTGGYGGIVLPDDKMRPWTKKAMRATARFMRGHGWRREKQFMAAHQYHLDDDPDLASDLVIVRQDGVYQPTPFAGRYVELEEIPAFYGRKVFPPYPRYVNIDASFDYSWNRRKEQAHEWQRSSSDKVA